MYFAKSVAYFLLILGSVFSDCVVLYGDKIINTKNLATKSSPESLTKQTIYTENSYVRQIMTIMAMPLAAYIHSPPCICHN